MSRKLLFSSIIGLLTTFIVNGQAPVANFTFTLSGTCTPAVLNVTDHSTGSPTSWTWNFGGIPPNVVPGSFSGPTPPAVIYSAPGTYTITLTVSNANGSSSSQQNITIYPSPIADFTASDSTGCAPLPVQFTNTSQGPSPATITKWIWDLGDGTIDSIDYNPSHTYTIPANYRVSLQVYNSYGCSGSGSLKTNAGFITIPSAIYPNFSDSLSSSCKPPTTAFFTNLSNGPGAITYSWTFGDGGSSTQFSPSHVYNAANIYSVSLTATSSLGCTATYTSNVNIGSGSVQSSFVAPDSVCVGTLTTFTNTSVPTPNSSNWSFGDGSALLINSPNATHTYSTAGNYSATLYNTFSLCSDSVTQVIHVFNPPTINFTAVNTTSCKPSLTVTFQNTSTGAVTYTWDFGDGSPTSNQVSPTHTYTTYGNFNVTLTASNAPGCSNSLTKSQFVQVDSPTVKISNLPAYGCAPTTFVATLSANAVDGVASYFWDFGNGNTYTVANPPPQVYGPGKYPVKVTIITTGGCTASFEDTVHVGTVKPVVAFSASPTSICVAGGVQFTDQSTPAGGVNQWLWDFGDGSTSNQQNPLHTYTNPGLYSVKLTAFDNGCFDVLTKANLITVNPPKAKFGYSFNCSNKNQYNFSDSSINATSWSWSFGDGNTSNTQNPTHTYAAAGNYLVKLIVTNGGCTDSYSTTVTVGQQISFVSTQNVICKNTLITISASILPGNATWSFDFGDGTPVQGGCYCSNWSHTYTTTGSFTVKVVVVDSSGCADSLSKPNFIQVNGPTAAFTTPITQSCSGFTANFSDQSTISNGMAVTNWFWDFGDGGTSNQPNPNHSYITQGIFPVKLKVTDASGCSDSLVKPSYITVSIQQAGFTSSDSNYCPGSIVQFKNVSTGGFNPTYAWNFGDGGNFNGPNPPPHTYATVGKFTVSLTMTDIYGCTNTFVRTNYINVDTPSASFTMSGSFAPCPPLLDNFTFTGHYAKSVQWDFGGAGHPNEGVSNTLPTTSHLYAFPGVYYPTLTVTSPGGCTAQTTDTVTILGPGLQTFAYTPVGGCDSLTVHFSVTSTGPGVSNYVWYFRDPNSDSAVTNHPDTMFTYLEPGTFFPAVRLIDSSNCGVTYPGSIPIVVDSVKAKFVSDKQLLCSNGTIQFKDSSIKQLGTVISNYFWDFGDGTTLSGAADSTPSHFYAAPGLYTVTMSVTTQFGCSDMTINVIKVVASPDIGINGVVSQCVPATLTFTGSEIVPDTSVLKWFWNFDNGQTDTAQNPAPQLYDKAGHYVITLSATNSSGCTTIDSADLFIYPLPVVYAGADTTICLGTSAQLQATGAVTYTWLPPSASSLSCTACSNPVATPTITTTYVVNGVSVIGCQANDTVVVTVNQPVTVTVGASDSVCLGQSTQLTASGAFFYAWTPAAGLSDPTIANPVATPTITTNYQVIGSDSKYCFSDTGYQQVTVFNYPTINVGADQTILVGSSYQINGTGSPDIVSLNWLPVTGLSCTTCLSPLATPQQTTTYVVSATNNGNCTTLDSIKITVICTDNNFFIPNTFSPNGDGVNDVFYVQAKGVNIIPSMTIFNRWGQIVFQKKNFAPNDPSQGWDGTINGQKAPVDVYVYTIDIICDNSTLIPYHGNVALIR